MPNGLPSTWRIGSASNLKRASGLQPGIVVMNGNASSAAHKASGVMAITFLALSMLSGFVELGSVVLLLDNYSSVTAILTAGLAYQSGNLIAGTVKSSARVVFIILFFALLSALAYSLNRNLLFLYIATAGASISIQRLRRVTKTKAAQLSISTFRKRLVRIIGFLLAGLMTVHIFSLVLGLLILIWFFVVMNSLSDWERTTTLTSKPRRSSLSNIMIVHQSHYFSYAYLIPILLALYLNIPISLIGLTFIVGWISYVNSERLLKRYSLTKVFILGHILVALSLLAIGVFYESLPLVMLFWFLSGIGGGTVFCLRRFNEAEGKNKVELDLWEDLGHVIGVVISITCTALFTNNVTVWFLVAALIAASTAFMMWRQKPFLAIKDGTF